MSTGWLNREIRSKSDAHVDGGDPILTVVFGERTEFVYCPTPDEYRITAAVVQKAKDLGATIVAYGEGWCGVTEEGREYGKELNISVMPYRSFFAYLRRYGVIFTG